MLSQLNIQNFAIVEQLEMSLQSGMTTITGETGAGKSISIDALSLCLGSRAESSMVRPNSGKLDISADFDVSQLPHAKQWLIDNDLDQGSECILRRTLTQDGRSKAYINGSPVPLAQLKTLGNMLVNIHGQHAHHALLKPEAQLAILDQYCGHHELLENTKQSYQALATLQKELKQLEHKNAEQLAAKQLLEYQIEELNNFAPEQNEYPQLSSMQKKLQNNAHIIEQTEGALYLLEGDMDCNIQSQLQQLLSRAENIVDCYPDLKDVLQMLSDAQIQLSESQSELQHFRSSLDIDPEQLEQTEARLSNWHELARKHHCQPENLYNYWQELAAQLEAIALDQNRSDDLLIEIEQAKQALTESAQTLSDSRQQKAQQLSLAITEAMVELSMPHGQFVISFIEKEQANAQGMDDVEFLVSINPGQPLQPMAKVASGGELSRIGLAMQVLTSERVATPTLIFDEVDVGISGPTAAVVGRMLKQLGKRTQIICVTHLPQVAANGDQQMYVSKDVLGDTTNTSMRLLDKKARINEIARLVAGDQITNAAIANAKQLLKAS
ncbi:DNA repair protein RecN [Paraferrimonas sp. SM1919]|uniref:DNA repair protein RecN n=1 Tax=Paraferrimonas sp. SM1919 TaxID=2662263 RepID=UPI0013D2E2D6|nr:DNA repair protein RecN [Paraferrimonas sp. SM1919]